MTPDPDLPGLSYDLAKARAIADGAGGVLRQAASLDATTNDQLAALAILVARVIRRSRLAKTPDAGAGAVRQMALEVLATGETSGLL